MTLAIEKVSKSFGARKVIREVSFSISSPGSLGIAGRNGSGKTTLMKMLCQLLPATRGRIKLTDGGDVESASAFHCIKMVSPEMALYEMLTGYENLTFFSTLAGTKMSHLVQDELLESVGLAGRGSDLVTTYSSGMKQRLKYAVALLAKPEILLLDEPTANLDAAGKAIVADIMAQQQRKGILIIATNETEDLKRVDRIINLDN
jgi:heme exporter protein A